MEGGSERASEGGREGAREGKRERRRTSEKESKRERGGGGGRVGESGWRKGFEGTPLNNEESYPMYAGGDPEGCDGYRGGEKEEERDDEETTS